jgi:beta-phosphoglucomutase-like phosphatase (HAD superfamily)
MDSARAPLPPSRARRARRRPLAVIFDMDGLLLDTEPLAARAWIDAAAGLGVAFDHAVTRRLVGRNHRDCAELIRAHHGAGFPVEDVMGAWHGAYEAIVEREGIVVKPGVFVLLDWLEAEAIPRAVATSTRRSRAESKLARTNLLDRFDALVGGDEIARGKPAPDIVIEAAARLAVAVADCVVLEDSEPGVTAALAAGAMPMMVPDLGEPSAALLARAPPIFASLLEVHAHLAALPPATRVR